MTRQEILDMQEGRELDKLVAEKIFGFKQLCYYGPPKDGSFWKHVDSVWYATAEEANAAYAAYWDKNHKDSPGGYIERDGLNADLGYWEDDWGPLACPDYSIDIADAFMIVEKLASIIWFFDLSCLPGDCKGNPNPKWEARFWDAEPCISDGVGEISDLEAYNARGETAPLAICRAALLVANRRKGE